jgi:hypothetical protein
MPHHILLSAAGLSSLVLAALFAVLTSAARAEDALALDYPPHVKEVIEQRCVVCHGCYDAPCQLKMDAYAGLVRGANPDKVYDGTRLIPANLTRLYEDAKSESSWRDQGFFDVLGAGDPQANLLLRMLALKEEHPLPTSGVLPDSFDFRLNRDQSCPTPDTFAQYAEERPLQGMPYALPGLDGDRLALLRDWLDSGARGVALTQPGAAEERAVADWETFLNGASNRERLMSRYIYEHLFIGTLYFDDLPERSARYTLVRSRTPPGRAIDLIATRRPYDDPGTETFYYRLQRRELTTLAKRHMPYALSEARMTRWRELFLEADYAIDALPGYQGESSANPFITFQQLPVGARYRFMLDEAQFTIMAYIKGPVCRGQVALNVIDDHFWVAFADPSFADRAGLAAFLAEHATDMRLPQAKGSLIVTLLQWQGYARSHRRYLEAEAKRAAEVIEGRRLQLDLDLIWDGDAGQNDNAALTVFRHFDSATVVKGFVGQQPKTMWLIDYSLLERIHYLLVAGFDVYGAVGHQLESRLYMDFLRMEGEHTFLLFLPENERKKELAHWYRDARKHVRNHLAPMRKYELPTAIDYRTKDPKAEFMQMLSEHIPAADNPRYRVTDPLLTVLMSEAQESFSFMPEVAFLQVLNGRGERRYYSLIHNQAFLNNAQLFREEDRRVPQEDTMTVARGFVGAYPNMFFQVTEKELERFVAMVRGLASAEDYTRLVERYGVRRSAPWFWRFSDDVHEAYRAGHPQEAGLFDLNRYENR